MLPNAARTLCCAASLTLIACTAAPDVPRQGGVTLEIDAGGTQPVDVTVEPPETTPVTSTDGSTQGGGTVPDAGMPPVVRDVPPAVDDAAAFSFSLVILPDTQYYTQRYPHLFTAQTQWIRDHAASEKIAFVLHEGDVTENNLPHEWLRARDSMSLLDDVVPYALVTGNHDLGLYGQATDRSTGMMDPFPVSHFIGRPTFGDVMEAGSMQNSFHLFSAGGRDYLVLALEFGPRDEVLTWAGALCGFYSTRQVIILTHNYLYWDDSRVGPDDAFNPHIYDIGRQGSTANDGEEMWQKLVSRHANIRFVFSGHQLGDGLGRLISIGEHGNAVVQVLTNFQVRPMGGEGFLRILRFSDDGRWVVVQDRSPALDTVLEGAEHAFAIDLQEGVFME